MSTNSHRSSQIGGTCKTLQIREGQRPRCPIRLHTGNEDVAPSRVAKFLREALKANFRKPLSHASYASHSSHLAISKAQSALPRLVPSKVRSSMPRTAIAKGTSGVGTSGVGPLEMCNFRRLVCLFVVYLLKIKFYR